MLFKFGTSKATMPHKTLFIALIITSFSLTGFSQPTFKITSYNTTPADFKSLLLSNKAIEDNDTTNERILDLCSPVVMDSVLLRKKEHHELFLVGWLIHAFGDFNWRAVSMVKKKFVGTIHDNARSGEEEFTEYDINYDLNFHLPKYLTQAFYCYDCQRKAHKQDIRRSHRTDYNKSPFVRDTNDINIRNYRMHCELTPPRCFRPQLNYLFYPTLPGAPSLKDYPNFGTDHPSMGFYGANCLDCNHNCHPEIHPYEWVWWMNLHNGSENAKTWLVGLFYESSNRFRWWSHNPKVGKMTFPFAFAMKGGDAKRPGIKIEHLVFNKFVDSLMYKLNVPENAFGTWHENQTLLVSDSTGNAFDIDLQFNAALPTNGLKFWLSDLNWDASDRILSGLLNMAVSVEDVYTAKITFTGQ
ncbi:MAG TPA: hypothetical protein VG603_06815 [Chitinophagales bacterium]|nr:hypothetical protein [Chitinophagales bacterium]